MAAGRGAEHGAVPAARAALHPARLARRARGDRQWPASPQRARPHPRRAQGGPAVSKGHPTTEVVAEIGAAVAAPAVARSLVSIVVPVQAPDAEVRAVVDALGGELDRMGREWECLFVFDGVRGRAWNEVQELSAERGERVRAIGFQQAFGDSVCLTAGVERARGDVILTSPQYVQVDPVSLADMLGALEAGADVVCPIRKPRVDPLLNRVQSALFNWAIRLIIRGEF